MPIFDATYQASASRATIIYKLPDMVDYGATEKALLKYAESFYFYQGINSVRHTYSVPRVRLARQATWDAGQGTSLHAHNVVYAMPFNRSERLEDGWTNCLGLLDLLWA